MLWHSKGPKTDHAEAKGTLKNITKTKMTDESTQQIMFRSSDAITINPVEFPPEDMQPEAFVGCPAQSVENLASDAILITTSDRFPQHPSKKVNISVNAHPQENQLLSHKTWSCLWEDNLMPLSEYRWNKPLQSRIMKRELTPLLFKPM
jgi:hypothetical protein